MKYRPEIDGLRAVAVVPVVLFHAQVPGFSGGYLGVDVFFVISGFLITSIVARQARENRFSIKTFYERRARRLMPALFAMLAAVVAGGWLFAPPRYLEEVGESLLAVVLYVSNIVFWRRVDYFATDAELNPLLHTWSLSVEEQYYVLFPTALALAIRYRPRLARWFVVAAMIVSFGIGEWASHAKPQAAFFLLPTRAWELLAGSTLALFPEIRERTLARPARELLPLAGLALTVLPMALYDTNVPSPGIWTTIPVLGSVLLIGWAGPTNLVGRLLSLKPVVHIGMISYSVYLWHQPLLAYERLGSVWHPHPSITAVVVLISFVLGDLSWRFIENPFRVHGRFEARRVFAATLAGSVVTAVVGLALIQTNGLPGRYSAGARDAFDLAETKASHPCLRNAGTPLDRAMCRRGPEAGPATTLLIGDSHSEMLETAIGELADQRRLAIDQTSFGACQPVFGLGSILGKHAKGCEAHNEKVYELAAAPSVDTLILAARWNTPFHGGVKTERCHENSTTRSPAVADAAAKATEDSLRRWLDLGKQVIVVLPVPEPGCDVPTTVAKLRQRGMGPFQLSRSEVLSRSERFRSIVADLPTERLTVIDPVDVLCDDEACSTERDGTILYRDDDHLNTAGARLVVDQLANVLR